jgi:hypothetical protein
VKTIAVFNAAFPVLPGKVEAARAFGEETMGARRADFEEYQKRRGVTRETWAVQENPDGSALSVVWIESPDIERALTAAAGDSSEFASWFRERVKEINGLELDPNQRIDAPKVTLDWKG